MLAQHAGRSAIRDLGSVPTGDGIGSNSEIELRPERFVKVRRLERNEIERVLAARDSDDVPTFEMRLLSPVED